MSEPTHVPERRPIAARERALSKWIASWLACRGVPANAISLAGMFSAIGAGCCFALTREAAWHVAGFLLAAVLMQVRLLANMFDGMVAIQSGRSSAIGALFNEVPDRISDAAIFIGAGYAAGSLPELGYLAACVALFVAYVRVQGKVAGAPQEYCGPMAKPQRMALLTAAAAWCALAPRAWQPILSDPPVGGLMSLALAIVVVGGLWTAWRRLTRIASSLRRTP